MAKKPEAPAESKSPPPSGGGPTGVEAAEKVFGVKAKRREYRSLPPLDAKSGQVPSFESYFGGRIDEIKTVQKLLETKLSDSPVVLESQIREIEAHYGRMTSILAWADSYLDLAERRELVARDPDYTDVDREIHLAAAVSRERRFRDVVKALAGSIETRISLGQSLLKSFHGEKR